MKRGSRFFLNNLEPAMIREYDKSEKLSLHTRGQKTNLRKALEQMDKDRLKKRGF